MPYVSRDDDGKINGIGDRPNRTDTEMARITEDLIDVLVSRNILNFTDFPVEAQKKLMARQKLRKSLSALSNLVTDEDDII